jgi:hypothetical protein
MFFRKAAEGGTDSPIAEGLSRTVDFLNRSTRKDSGFSWGLVLLIAFGIYALGNVIYICVKLFN